MSSVYAQTNLQLHHQLVILGYSAADQEYIASAHQLGADLFSGQYRGSGKPFIAHLVGTASILAAMKMSPPVLAAGLLHAAYDQGDFGLGLLRRHPDKRAELKSVIGAEAEDYIQRYFVLRWTDDVIAGLHARVDGLSPTDRLVVVIRLANELEDYLDSGVLFCGNSDARLARLVRIAEDHVTLARQLGQPGLADELAHAFADARGGAVPSGVRNQNGHSRVRPPRSYARKYVSRLRSYLAARS
jgi:hypothetical protein